MSFCVTLVFVFGGLCLCCESTGVVGAAFISMTMALALGLGLGVSDMRKRN